MRSYIGPHEDLLATVAETLVVWACHKVSELAKTILQGTVQGKRKRGRQRRRWEDNITEWTGKALSDNLRKAGMYKTYEKA